MAKIKWTEQEPTHKQIEYAKIIEQRSGCSLEKVPFNKCAYFKYIADHKDNVSNMPYKSDSIYEGDIAGNAYPTYINDIVDCYDFGIYPWGDS